MGGGKTTQTQTADPETQASTRFMRKRIAEPLANQFIPILQSFLTGGLGSQLPIVQRGVEGVRGASSSAMGSIQEMLARAGLANTPFGARQVAESTQQGEQAAAGVGPQYANQFLSQVPGMITGTNAAIINAGAGKGTTTQSTTTSPFGDIMSLLGMLGGSAIMAYGGKCWIASALYGPTSKEFIAARYWIYGHWPIWVLTLYSRFGECLSKSKIALFILKPIFDRAVAKGSQKLYQKLYV